MRKNLVSGILLAPHKNEIFLGKSTTLYKIKREIEFGLRNAHID